MPFFNYQNITEGTIGSLLAAILTYIVTVIFHFRIPGPSSILFWNKFRKTTYIVTSEIPALFDPNPIAGAGFGIIPVGETLSLINIFTLFRFYRKSRPNLIWVHSIDDYNSIKYENVLIVGGPKFNLAARLFLKHIDPKINYQFMRILTDDMSDERSQTTNLKQIVSKSSTKQSYWLSPDSDNEYGMLIVTRNPYNASKFIVCAAGLNQLSTYAAIQWFSQISLFTIIKYLLLNFGFQAIISCTTPNSTTATNIKLEAIEPIRREQ